MSLIFLFVPIPQGMGFFSWHPIQLNRRPRMLTTSVMSE